MKAVPSTGGLAVSVLGGFVLRNEEGAAFDVPAGSQRLLAFLALRNGTVSRALVAGMLWPDAPDSRAYSSLRSALSRLEQAGRMAVQTSKLELSLAEQVTVDLPLARQLAHRVLASTGEVQPADLAPAAISSLSAELLPNWYDDWVLVEAEEWRQLRLHALEMIARRLAARARWGEAANAASAAVRIDPLRETAHAVLIEIHLAEGNQSEALREYLLYRALLNRELGVEPTPRLYRLVADLKP